MRKTQPLCIFIFHFKLVDFIFTKSTSPSVLYSFHKVDAGLRLYHIQHHCGSFATAFLQFCKNWNMSQKQDAFVSIVPRRKTGFLPNTGKNGNRSPWGGERHGWGSTSPDNAFVKPIGLLKNPPTISFLRVGGFASLTC